MIQNNDLCHYMDSPLLFLAYGEFHSGHPKTIENTCCFC